MRKSQTKFTTHALFGLSLAYPILSGCTGQVPGTFRLAQQSETFTSSQTVNTKLDILWVVDNSASMDPSQNSLRNGFASFAAKYLQPTWDIRVGVITSDTYLANLAYTQYRQGDTYHPKWDGNWGKLLPGNHDGPMTGLCNTNNAYFYKGYSQCSIRDAKNQTGTADCINPGSGLTSTTQCVNTTNNDTVHSNVPVISTQPPAGTPADAAWTTGLVNNFVVNVSTGSAGSGIERGLGSILEMIQDNEVAGSAHPLFRPNSLRVIVIVSDEDDQTVDLTGNTATNLAPDAGYFYDNADTQDSGTHGACRSRTVPCTPGKCSGADPNNYTYTISFCAPQPESTTLMSLPKIKSTMDSFFLNLDGTAGKTGANPNYFMVSIVPTTGEAIQALHAQRGAEDNSVIGHARITSDYGKRYVDFGNLVANGSFASNLVDPAAPDTTNFQPILDSIGRVIVQKKAVFTLTRAPADNENTIVTVMHGDGSSTVIDQSLYTVSGTTLTITDNQTVLNLKDSDRINVSYQPKSSF